MGRSEGLINSLTALGFSSYEAKTYVGLLHGYGQTAYALSKDTGVPQPKIYDAIRKLIARRAAVQINEKPQRFAATPPDELLRTLRSDMAARIDAAERMVAQEAVATEDQWPEVMTSMEGLPSVLTRATALIESSTDKIYLSAWADQLKILSKPLEDAAGRGVDIIILAFGRTTPVLNGAQVYSHKSTAKALYPNHQNRHLALVSDGNTSLWGLASNGGEWTALISEDFRMVGLVRSFIRHDIYVQKLYARFGPEIEATFGPGLEFLTDVLHDITLTDGEPATTTETQRRVG